MSARLDGVPAPVWGGGRARRGVDDSHPQDEPVDGRFVESERVRHRDRSPSAPTSKADGSRHIFTSIRAGMAEAECRAASQLP